LQDVNRPTINFRSLVSEQGGLRKLSIIQCGRSEVCPPSNEGEDLRQERINQLRQLCNLNAGSGTPLDVPTIVDNILEAHAEAEAKTEADATSSVFIIILRS
jgi:hypothetical protein